MFSAEQVAAGKPAPDVFLLAARQMGVPPQHCAVVEDSPVGVRAATAAGMSVFDYAALTPADALLQAGAAQTFDDMRRLPELLGCPAADSRQCSLIPALTFRLPSPFSAIYPGHTVICNSYKIR